MTIKSLPAAPEGRPFAREKPDLPAAAMERWNGGICAQKKMAWSSRRKTRTV